MNLSSLKARIRRRRQTNREGITLLVDTVEEMIDYIEKQTIAIQWARETLQMMIAEDILEYIDFSHLDVERGI